MKSFLEYIGTEFIIFLDFLGGLSILGLKTVSSIVRYPWHRVRLFQQANRVGVDSLPLISLLALFQGIILALNTAYQLKRLGSEMYIAGILSVSMVRELGPVITALILAGRVGAAITAEIATMQVTEQVDALRTLANDPVRYLVVPRFLSFSVMLPLLVLFANAIGIFGGYLICVYRLNIASRLYTKIAFDSLLFKDLYVGLVKSVVFGMIIALVSCFEGFRVTGGAEGVGKATTRCVVSSFILIIAADCIFTALFYFLMP
ncbi:MAG: ABC transporter permease [Candidatus Omnitrophica bacterium]|nr:ABC transporter permease [Candidatus Omnitrophota bacterium]MDD5236862.1 ABC transporter permease [Candidatus Omnitrophota bacterium]MDD5610120.1 ABC transporter permease [Candidatus Omnitrophota bacterium]